MKKCIDDRFRKMLESYELGLLNEKDREEFELHLMDCQHCLESVLHFAEVSRHLCHSTRAQQKVAQLAKEPSTLDNVPRDRLDRDRQGSKWLRYMPIPLATAAALVLLILNPWQLEFRPTQTAIAAENRLVVLYFENLSDPGDPARLREVIPSLLITDLSESRQLMVVSSQRLRDILMRLGQDSATVIERDIATRVAEEAAARWMLLGSIVQSETDLALSTQLVEVISGDVISSQRVNRNPDETVFSLVDRLSASVRADLRLAAAAGDEHDPRVADITTHSTEAYRCYLEGLDYESKLYYAEAVTSFTRALEYDSTFAMAYYYLAGLENPELINKAMEYSDHASRKEQLYIGSKQAWFAGDTSRYVNELQTIVQQFPDESEAFRKLGKHCWSQHRYEEAIGYLNRALEIDSSYKNVYNDLAYIYDEIGDFEKAILAINNYITIAPDEANPYDSRAEIYARNGKLDLAIESYEKALDIKPDFPDAAIKLASLYMFRGEYAKAEYWFGEPARMNLKGTRPGELLDLATLLIYQGEFAQALESLDRGLDSLSETEIAATHPQIIPHLHAWKASVFEFTDVNRAVQSIETAIELSGRAFPDNKWIYRPFYARLLAESGNISRADEVAQELKRYLEKRGSGLHFYWQAAGMVEMIRGNLQKGVSLLEKGADSSMPALDFNGHYLVAVAYLESGQISRAVRKFEQLLSIYSLGRASSPNRGPLMHYYLGVAYEESRWYDEAVEQYEAFLDIWGDTDSRIAFVENARQRLARLTSGP